MAELADALASGARLGNLVQVQVLSSAPKKRSILRKNPLILRFFKFYKDSYDADVNDIRRMYSERDENGNVIEPSEGIIQEEVVAHFVEKKLLTVTL